MFWWVIWWHDGQSKRPLRQDKHGHYFLISHLLFVLQYFYHNFESCCWTIYTNRKIILHDVFVQLQSIFNSTNINHGQSYPIFGFWFKYYTTKVWNFKENQIFFVNNLNVFFVSWLSGAFCKIAIMQCTPWKQGVHWAKEWFYTWWGQIKALLKWSARCTQSSKLQQLYRYVSRAKQFSFLPNLILITIIFKIIYFAKKIIGAYEL